MSVATKPQGYSTVSVYIVAQGAQKVIDFLKKAFDASELRRFDKPDGSIMHAEMRIGDSVVMISDGSEAYPSFPVWLHVYVDDVDKFYQKALTAGGVSAQEPVRKEHEPDKRGGVKDPCGNTWWIATQVAEG
jgi:PhnB protein